MSFLKASGVTTGDDLGNFNPDSPITRQEFAVLLCRWLAPAQDTSSVELPFADSNRIADWAKDGVHAMYALGNEETTTALPASPRPSAVRRH